MTLTVMKKVIKPISRLVRNIFRMIRDIFSSKTRFFRISPYAKGEIFFFDKKKYSFFSLFSRGEGDSSVLDAIFPKHCYSLEGMRRSEDIYSNYRAIVSLGKRPLIIDCGANIGASTYFLASEFPEATIVGIELELDNSNLAKKNNAYNNNVNILHAAIGPVNGLVEIENPEEEHKDSFRVSINAKLGSNSIQMLSISDIKELYPDSIPFITKIDIEGFENELFSKNTDWIKDFYLITLEIHDWMMPKQSPSKNFFREHSKENRDCYLKGDMVFSIKN